MSVEAIKSEIRDLSASEYQSLRDWFAQRDQALWDEQVEADSKSGALDFLKREAIEERVERSL